MGWEGLRLQTNRQWPRVPEGRRWDVRPLFT